MTDTEIIEQLRRYADALGDVAHREDGVVELRSVRGSMAPIRRRGLWIAAAAITAVMGLAAWSLARDDAPSTGEVAEDQERDDRALQQRFPPGTVTYDEGTGAWILNDAGNVVGLEPYLAGFSCHLQPTEETGDHEIADAYFVEPCTGDLFDTSGRCVGTCVTELRRRVVGLREGEVVLGRFEDRGGWVRGAAGVVEVHRGDGVAGEVTVTFEGLVESRTLRLEAGASAVTIALDPASYLIRTDPQMSACPPVAWVLDPAINSDASLSVTLGSEPGCDWAEGARRDVLELVSSQPEPPVVGVLVHRAGTDDPALTDLYGLDGALYGELNSSLPMPNRELHPMGEAWVVRPGRAVPGPSEGSCTLVDAVAGSTAYVCATPAYLSSSPTPSSNARVQMPGQSSPVFGLGVLLRNDGVYALVVDTVVHEGLDGTWTCDGSMLARFDPSGDVVEVDLGLGLTWVDWLPDGSALAHRTEDCGQTHGPLVRVVPETATVEPFEILGVDGAAVVGVVTTPDAG